VTRALVVDDEADLRMLARLILEGAGFEVSEATGGAESLDRLDQEPFDLLLLDLRMPPPDGWDVLAELQRRGRPGALRILVASAHVEPTIRARVIDSGCDGFLAKPFTPDALLDAVRGVLA
jgi:two-component system response regulator ResD